MGRYRVISADSHVVEIPDLWTDRIEPRWRDRGPHMVREEDGDWWYCDDYFVAGLAAGGGQATTRFDDPESLSRADVMERLPKGGFIPDEAVKDMDVDGVDVSLLYPSIGLLLYRIPDSDLLTAIFHAYNDWVGEFCGAHPGRLKGVAMLNGDDLPSALQELERCNKMGFAGTMISVYPYESRPYSLQEYEPLWSAVEEAGIPLAFHIGTNRPGPGQVFSTRDEQRGAHFFVNVDHWPQVSLTHMIFSGVFERHPGLKVVVVEHELSWVPHFLERMDYNYLQRAREISPYRFKDDMVPSDFFHKQVFIGVTEDALGVSQRHLIGTDNILWGSDYPHPETSFPRSQQTIEEIFADCTEEEKAKFVGENTAKVYGL